jgi:ribokinase
MTPGPIIVIGSANVDYVIQMPRLPQKGETVTQGTFMRAFGGKGANQAVAAARAGGRVIFVTSLGSDSIAKEYLEALQDDGIDCRHIVLETDHPTGSALVMIDEAGDNYLAVAPGSNYAVSPARIWALEATIASCSWVVLQQEVPVETNQVALEMAARHNVPVLLNYAPAQEIKLQRTTAVHGLVVNELEAAQLSETTLDPDDLIKAKALASALRTSGEHRFVAITLGERGVVLATPQTTQHIPAHQVKSRDSTAAGDTFCGVLVVGLSEGQSIETAISMGCAASALTVTRIGAQCSIPTRQEIVDFRRLHHP